MTPKRALGSVAAAAAVAALAPGPSPAAAPAAAHRATWRPGVAAARRYAQRRAGVIGFAVKDLDGRLRQFNGRRTAPMASVFKVMLLATYLRRPSVRDRPLRASDRRLLAPMIRHSDSGAATRVRDIVGVRAIERLARDARMHSFRYRSVWGLSRTDAIDQARFMYHLDRFIPRRHRSYAMHLLATVVRSQRWGIGRARPRGWHLYFKGGWGSGTGRVDHQVALLARHGHRVAIAILTQFDPSHRYGEHTLEGISRRLLRGLSRIR